MQQTSLAFTYSELNKQPSYKELLSLSVPAAAILVGGSFGSGSLSIRGNCCFVGGRGDVARWRDSICRIPLVRDLVYDGPRSSQ